MDGLRHGKIPKIERPRTPHATLLQMVAILGPEGKAAHVPLRLPLCAELGLRVRTLRIDTPPFSPTTQENRTKTGDFQMPTMSNLRRRKIQNNQLKAENAAKRIAKAAKKERNAKKAG